MLDRVDEDPEAWRQGGLARGAHLGFLGSPTAEGKTQGLARAVLSAGITSVLHQRVGYWRRKFELTTFSMDDHDST